MAMVPVALDAASASPCIYCSPLFRGPKPLPFLRLRFRFRLRRSPPSVAFARRRWPSKYKTKIQNKEVTEDDVEDDALEALFEQLEDDLKNDNLSLDDADDEISEEDMAKFEQELAEALGEVNEDDESIGNSLSDSEDYGNDEETDEIQRPQLKNWQLRRLARALKIGRRKTSIKSLAGELGLDRAVVLDLLRNPPPNLLLMSDSLPDEAPSKPETKEIESSPTVDDPTTDGGNATEDEPQVELPIHVMRTGWNQQKRLKKVQLETLERVYFRTKRPTNTLINSIVQVTNLPRKTIIKWFEDRREQEGVPDRRAPFKRSLADTIAS